MLRDRCSYAWDRASVKIMINFLSYKLFNKLLSKGTCLLIIPTRFSSGPPAFLEPSTNSVLLSLC